MNAMKICYAMNYFRVLNRKNFYSVIDTSSLKWRLIFINVQCTEFYMTKNRRTDREPDAFVLFIIEIHLFVLFCDAFEGYNTLESCLIWITSISAASI